MNVLLLSTARKWWALSSNKILLVVTWTGHSSRTQLSSIALLIPWLKLVLRALKMHWEPNNNRQANNLDFMLLRCSRLMPITSWIKLPMFLILRLKRNSNLRKRFPLLAYLNWIISHPGLSFSRLNSSNPLTSLTGSLPRQHIGMWRQISAVPKKRKRMILEWLIKLFLTQLPSLSVERLIKDSPHNSDPVMEGTQIDI